MSLKLSILFCNQTKPNFRFFTSVDVVKNLLSHPSCSHQHFRGYLKIYDRVNEVTETLKTETSYTICEMRYFRSTRTRENENHTQSEGEKGFD